MKKKLLSKKGEDHLDAAERLDGDTDKAEKSVPFDKEEMDPESEAFPFSIEDIQESIKNAAKGKFERKHILFALKKLEEYIPDGDVEAFLLKSHFSEEQLALIKKTESDSARALDLSPMMHIVRRKIEVNAFDEAEAILGKMLRLKPYNHDYLLAMAYVLLQKKKYAQATDVARLAKDVAPKDPWGWYLFAQSLFHENRLSLAEKAFQQVEILAVEDGDEELEAESQKYLDVLSRRQKEIGHP